MPLNFRPVLPSARLHNLRQLLNTSESAREPEIPTRIQFRPDNDSALSVLA